MNLFKVPKHGLEMELVSVKQQVNSENMKQTR